MPLAAITVVCDVDMASQTDVDPDAAIVGAYDDVLRLPADAGLSYVLAWDWRGAQRDESTQEWVFETDLGYVVGLQSGHLASASVELIPCLQATARRAPTGLSLTATARAAHTVAVDVSHSSVDRIESFEDASTMAGTAVTGGAAYCKAHYLVAPSPAATHPDGTQLGGYTLRASGWYLPPDAPGDATPTPFDLALTLPSGAIRTMTQRSEAPSLDADAEVTVTRTVPRAFDGVLFEELEDIELAYEFLNGIARSTTVTFALAQ
ncbi:MAG: hypothetical protein ACI9MR_004812 [Myxococcota bacterium]|jgi:hypothetical protein